MMKLSSMVKVVETVTDEWKSPLAEKILERWGYDKGTVYYFRSSANFLFVFKRNGNSYFLRFIDSSEKDFSQIESEMEILEYLRNQPIRVALPVASLTGNLIETIETDIATFHAVVFEALAGDQFEVEDLQQNDFNLWGRQLGRLHKIFKAMPMECRESRMNWQEQLSLAEKALPEHEEAARKELAELKEWAEGLPISNENFGLIHYDFELDNHRWLNDDIGILDFDDCMTHWYVADIAFALRELLKTDAGPKNPNVIEFINGYQEECQLDAQLIADFPNFIRMHNFLTFVGLLRTVDIQESDRHPEWLGNLRAKLVEYINYYRSAFMKI
ncbi:phosphotransferase [Bacillus sp. JJ1122]|uniref:phosphotransferase enzyme family protein n=1 Tax=Bacillus sp. JJ1122 TaxID=3122951 RepID=UPI002FFE158F